MDVNEITFGVEIECFIPTAAFRAAGIVRGGYHRGTPVPGFPAGWNAQSDCSIHSDGRVVPHSGFEAVEIVSGIMKGPEGIAQLREVLAKLVEMGARVNQSTGLHIHVGVSREAKGLKKLIRLAAQHEKAIYASTGTKDRERATYARPIKTDYFQFKDIKSIDDLARCHDRYKLLNLTNLIGGHRNTAEFRAFAGTLNITKIEGYVQLCVGLVHKAFTESKCTPAFTRRDEPTTGVAAIAKLMKILKWNRNGGFGIVDATSVKGIKIEFNRLAAKYDADL
jgi:hypothetical protein